MTDDEINNAIAEACGWTNIHMHREEDFQLEWLVGNPPEPPAIILGLPSFHKSLNSMHEAYQTLGYDQSNQFINELATVIMGTGEKAREEYLKSPLSSIRMAVNATAKQRAEAFLRTVGKWKD